MPVHQKQLLRAAVGAAAIVLVASAAVPAAGSPRDPADRDPADTRSNAPLSSFAGTAQIEPAASVQTESDGDLWPSCWAKNDTMYTANGDGKGFDVDGEFSDIAVSRLTGNVPDLTGTTVARGDEVGQVWSGDGYTRKPTGMVCVGNTIYLAVQDLAFDFNDVPAATIVKSTDGGKTWDWNTKAPMFDDHTFTTIWFADHGRGNEQAPDRYVYAYGLDGNWRDSFDDTVEDPQDVFLARVPKQSIQNRAAWQFYTGQRNGAPQWSSKIKDRSPVLHDDRRLYEHTYTNGDPQFSVISQGGVTYNPGLKRYIYTSWTEYTYEFYESQNPWGPWKRFLSKDFGGYPWTDDKFGGYGTTIPSKFISDDGRTMYVQSNVCPCAPAGMSNYHYSLRKLELNPLSADPADNKPVDTNLATAGGTVAISKSSRSGNLDHLNDGDPATTEDDFDDEVKSESWWGYTWPKQKLINRLSYTTGEVSKEGGWFTARPRVEVKDADGQWVNADGQTITPSYPGDDSAGEQQTYQLDFAPVATSGVRVIGFPSGTRTFTSIGELEASYRTQVADPGFEAHSGGSAWQFDGPAGHGVDRGLGFEHTGSNNAWIRTSGSGFSALSQDVPVRSGQDYTVSVWTQSSPGMTGGRLQVTDADGGDLGQVEIPAQSEYGKHQITVTVPEGHSTINVSVGFEGNDTDQYLQIDDVGVRPADG